MYDYLYFRRNNVKNLLKKMAVLTVITALLSTTMLGCARRSIDHEAIVSTVNGTEITVGFANFYARIQQAQQEMFHLAMGGEDGADLWAPDPLTGASQEPMFKEFIMTSIHDMFLMYQNAGDFGVSISPEDRENIEEAAARFVADNTDDALEAISGQLENVILILEMMTIRERMSEAMGEGIDTFVSDEEAVQRGMEYVFIPFVDAAGVPMDEIAAGALIAVVQGILTDVRVDGDIGAFEHLGEISYATFGEDSFSPAVELIDEMMQLNNVGEMSRLVETGAGLYVGQLVTLRDEIATEIHIEEILERRRGERLNELMEEWRQAATIHIDEEVWDKVSFRALGVLIYHSEED